MDDLARELASLREELTPDWDEARSERLFQGVARLGRQRRRKRALLGGAACVALLGGLALGLPRASEPAPQALAPAPDLPLAAAETAKLAPPARSEPLLRLKPRQSVRLADGSSAQVASADGELAVLRNEPKRIELALNGGLAHFEVVPNQARAFAVRAGALSVLVVGTVFDVEHAGERVRVAVMEGKVRVQTPSGELFVSAGESRWFGPEDPQLSAANESRSSAGREPRAQERSARVAAREHARAKRAAREERAGTAPKSSWRSLSQSGDYEAAFQLLAEGATVDDDPEALMDAADTARLSGHAEASIGYLRRVLRDHRKSPVAALAGFTLGRVLLERMGQPSEAAEAFALARDIAPQGSLAQDALAREVEAWSKAGNSHDAYRRAQLYVQLYPAGRRLRAVRLYGGLE